MPSRSGMRRSKKFIFGITALTALFLCSGDVLALTSNQNISLSANVSAACRIMAVTNVIFISTYDPISKIDNDSGVGSFSYSCTKGVVHWLYITGVRQMTGATDVLDFELYKEVARLTPFDSSKSGGGTTTVSNLQQIISLFGRIPAKQNVKPGIYSTTLVINVEY